MPNEWGRGFYGAGGDPVGAAIANLGVERRQSQQMQGEQQQRQLYLLSKLMDANPAHAQEIVSSFFQQNPELAKSLNYNYNPSGFTPTIQEINAQKRGGIEGSSLDYLRNQQGNGNGPMTVDPTRASFAFMPKEGEQLSKDSLALYDRNAVLSNPSQYAPGVVNSVLTQQKMIPTGYESQDLAQLAPVRQATAANQTAEATYTGGARTQETLAKKVEDLASASEHTAKAKSASSADQSVVQGWLARVNRGEIAAQDLGKYIKDPNTLKAVQNNLATGQGAIQHPLDPQATKALGEIMPIRQQMDDLIQKFEPYKGNNTPGYFTLNRAKYALGVAPDEASLAGQIANLELAKITGAMPYATKSRNFQYIKQIQEHLPRAWVDSPKNIYDKLQIARANMDRIIATENAVGRSGQVNVPLPGNPTPAGAASQPTHRWNVQAQSWE